MRENNRCKTLTCPLAQCSISVLPQNKIEPKGYLISNAMSRIFDIIFSLSYDSIFSITYPITLYISFKFIVNNWKLKIFMTSHLKCDILQTR